MCLNILFNIADLYREIYETNIVTDLRIDSCKTECDDLDIILSHLIIEGFNIGISENMCDFLGCADIEDIQYQFYDIKDNQDGDFIAFIVQQDFNVIAISKKNLKIYCSMQGEDYTLVADNLKSMLHLIEHMLKYRLNNVITDEAKTLDILREFIYKNKSYHNQDYLIDYFYG